MNYGQAKEVLNSARSDPLVLSSDNYIEAQLCGNWFWEISFQMGPNCNLNCSHCYGDFGVNRKGLPSSELAKKVIYDSKKLNLTRMVLTDGESIREENREVLGLFAKNSKKLPLAILTNGLFANTFENANDWFNFLKNNGFNLERTGNLIQVSMGKMYNVPLQNYSNINSAIKKIYPGSDFGAHMGYAFVSIDDTQENEILKFILDDLGGKFGKPDGVSIEEHSETNGIIHLKYKKSSSMDIDHRFCDPDGRAVHIPKVIERFPQKKFKLQDLDFSADSITPLWISSKGEVSYGASFACVRPQKIYGNVMNEPLDKIVDKIQNDPIYQAFRLGGVKFLYSLSKQLDPSFEVSGRIKCDVCHAFFSEPEPYNSVYNLLKTNDVVNTYKKYIEKVLEEK